jgi:hypothetical protein
MGRDVADARRVLKELRSDLAGLGGTRLSSVRQIANSALDYAEEFATTLGRCADLLRRHEVLLFKHLEIPPLVRRAKEGVIREYNRTVRTAAANASKAVTSAEADKTHALNAEFAAAMPKKGLRYGMIVEELDKRHQIKSDIHRVRYVIEGSRRSTKVRRPRE